MHSDSLRGGTAWLKWAPCSSSTTSSPGASSRSTVAPMMSSAQRLGCEHPGVVDAADHQRADAVGIAEPGDRVLGEDDGGEGALDLLHRVGDGGAQVARRVVRDQRRDHLGVRGRVQPHPLLAQLVAEGGRVGQVAVVGQRDRPAAGVLHDRLGVAPDGRAGGRVARVADRHPAGQRRQLRLVEHLVDEAHVLHRHHPAAVGDGDARALLAAVLQRVEAEVGEPCDVAVGGADRVVDAEDAAHQAPTALRDAGVVQRGRLGQRQLRGADPDGRPADRADLAQRHVAGELAQRGDVGLRRR